ncbi:hypothetical protein LCGC14_0487290 [marine sediment metagenome]|uniref:Uncharacterized protein n=1 Tax=marine sediment metagenome TaxID=412755 RepID=A0A0F9S7L8_9ZZZZ
MNPELQKYIKPGEFTFCSRCGHICRMGLSNFMCVGCTDSLFSKPMTAQESEELQLKIVCQKKVSDVIMTYREELARYRKDLNIKGVKWVNTS